MKHTGAYGNGFGNRPWLDQPAVAVEDIESRRRHLAEDLRRDTMRLEFSATYSRKRLAFVHSSSSKMVSISPNTQRGGGHLRRDDAESDDEHWVDPAQVVPGFVHIV